MWHASTELEREEIQRCFGVNSITTVVPPASLSIHVASDIAIGDQNEPEIGRQKIANTVRLCFISRITRKKNLDMALRVVSRVRYPVTFEIYGTVDDPGYLQECKDLASRICSTCAITWGGPISHDEVENVLGSSDALLLPTLGENFGHIIAEALWAGTPVVISDATPWRRLTESCAGFDVPLVAEDRFVEAIERIAVMDHAVWSLWSAGARKYINKELDVESVVARNRAMFEEATTGGTPGGSVE
jgi:glycosyltransferase involved in cell wall biosynthesis